MVLIFSFANYKQFFSVFFSSPTNMQDCHSDIAVILSLTIYVGLIPIGHLYLLIGLLFNIVALNIKLLLSIEKLSNDKLHEYNLCLSITLEQNRIKLLLIFCISLCQSMYQCTCVFLFHEQKNTHYYNLAQDLFCY